MIATASIDEKARLAREAGADEAVGYEGFAEHARELTRGEGVAAVSGPLPPVDPMRLEQSGLLFLTRRRCGTTPSAGRNCWREPPRCSAGSLTASSRMRVRPTRISRAAARPGSFCW